MITYKKLNLNDLGLLLLRLVLGFTMLLGHGLGKWQKLFAGAEIQFADPFALGELPSLAMVVFAEVICAILIVVGLKTRWATLPLIVTMFTAIFVIHIADGFGKMELPLLYSTGFLTLLLTGAGEYSLENFLNRRKIIINNTE